MTPWGDPAFARIGNGSYEIAHSPNGRFRVGWDDSAPGGNVGGYRTRGRGRWVVLDGEHVLAHGTLERPTDGAICDSGRFILTDWLFGDRSAGAFYAFAPDGRVLIAEHHDAHAHTSAISPDGRFAAFATAPFRDEAASPPRLLAFDLDAGRRLWDTDLPNRVASIAIDGLGDAVRLELSDVGHLDVRLRDGFIEPDAFRKATFSANPFGALDLIADELKAASDPLDAGAVEQWSQELDAARELLSDYPLRQARAWRLKGEMAERLRRPSDALEAYIRAVGLDPHIGVRRRIAALGGTVAPAPVRAREAEPSVDDRPYASEICPSCGIRLSPLPKAKKACAECGEPMYVRGGPDGRRHLLRTDELAENNAWWARGQTDRDEARQRAAEERRAAELAADRAAGLLVGDYRPNVVDESLYQAAIVSLVGEHTPGVVRVEFVAELVREGSTLHDRDAVDVMIDGRKVGNLSRDDVQRVAPMLQRLEQGRGPRRCWVSIIGGFDDARSGYCVYIKGIPKPHKDESG